MKFDDAQLIELNGMNLKRAEHNFLVLNDNFYALGGLTETVDRNGKKFEDFTDRCECFYPKDEVWKEIAPMTCKSINFSTCTFGDRFIYKFGGKMNHRELCHQIERFDTTRNLWEPIPLRVGQNEDISRLSFGCCAGSIQVSENEIFVFGGMNQDYSEGITSSFVLRNREDGSHIIERIDQYPLPIREAFWSQQAIIHDGVIYALQNIASEGQNKKVFMDNRRLLVYSGQRWRAIN